MSEIFEHRKVVNDSVDELVDISNLLHAVGLSKLAKRLDAVSLSLTTSIATTIEDHMNKLDEMVTQSSQNTKNILEALVTGVDLGRRETID